MTTELALFGGATLIAVAFVRGLRFRRGSDRGLLGIYRNTGLPLVLRNLALVLPFTMGSALLIFAIGAARYFQMLGEPTVENDAVLAILGFEVVFVVFAATIGVAYKAPHWLTPDWLRDDDRLVGYEPPRRGLLDHVWLLIAIAVLAVGAYFVVVVASLLPSGGID